MISDLASLFRRSAAVRQHLREYEVALRDGDKVRQERARLALIDVAKKGIFA